MDININDRRGTTEASLPGEASSPEKFEKVEIWTFGFVGGGTVNYVIHVERNEQATVMTNAIDQTPVEVLLLFRSDDDKNEVAGGMRMPVRNLLFYGKEITQQRVYEKGESPLEKELKRLQDKQVERANLFERRAADREAAFDHEMAEAEK